MLSNNAHPKWKYTQKHTSKLEIEKPSTHKKLSNAKWDLRTTEEYVELTSNLGASKFKSRQIRCPPSPGRHLPFQFQTETATTQGAPTVAEQMRSKLLTPEPQQAWPPVKSSPPSLLLQPLPPQLPQLVGQQTLLA